MNGEDIEMITEKMSDILERMNANVEEFRLDYAEKGNVYAGNPMQTVQFAARINGLDYKQKTFVRSFASESDTDFINRIKAYMLDVLDGVANL